MSDDGEPERQDSSEALLAEALRAKAGQTAGNASVATGESSTDRLSSAARSSQQSVVQPGEARIGMGWVLVLAVLLGLVTGTLIGLLTVV